MKILGNAERSCRRGPAEWFTGEVWIDQVLDPAWLGGGARVQAAQVTFTPGARTNWHTHPLGQTLFVVSGLGWVQLEGEPAKAIRPGDVVAIAPGENHWHGAEVGHTMSHLAMQEADESGSPVTWGRAVSDEEYGAAK
jgi:quercetin dioxygenase-like cupin family protein